MMQHQTTVESSLRRFWFGPQGAETLGFARLVFFALMIWFYFPLDYAPWGGLTPAFANRPLFAFRILHLPIVSETTLGILQFVWRASLVTACIGLFTRTSVIVAALLGFYVLGVQGNFGKVGHGEGILILAMCILALSRCGDAWSIDSLIRAFRSRDPIGQRNRPISGEYRWPIRMIWLLMSMIFLGAGITKLRWSGLDWITTDNLSTTILSHYYNQPVGNEWKSTIGIWIANHRTLCKVVAGLTILIEIGFPLAMFSRWARAVLVPSAFLAQVGIYVMMGVAFTQFMFVYVFWIPWDTLGRFVRRIAQRRGKYEMLYDGGCGLCKGVASVVVRLDVFGRVEPMDVVHRWKEIAARHPNLTREQCLTDMHVVRPDGVAVSRFIAYRNLAWALPVCWPILPLLYIPPIPSIADRIYQYVATHRHDAGCEIA